MLNLCLLLQMFRVYMLYIYIGTYVCVHILGLRLLPGFVQILKYKTHIVVLILYVGIRPRR